MSRIKLFSRITDVVLFFISSFFFRYVALDSEEQTEIHENLSAW